MRTGGRPGRAEILLLGCSIAVSALAFEVGARVFLFGVRGLWPPVVDSVQEIGDAGVLRPSEYRSVLFELQPNLSRYLKAVWFETNEEGLRDRDYPVEKEPTTFRVAVLGDSYTMADGVPAGLTYHSLLETRLDQAGTGRVEFVNFAVAGYQLSQYVGVLEHRVPAYSPDLVMIGFTGTNDFEVFSPEAQAFPYEVKPRTHPAVHPWSVTLARRVVGEMVYSAFPERRRQPAAFAVRESYNAEEQRYVGNAFRRIAELSVAMGAEPVVVYLLHHTRKPALVDQTRDLAEAAGLHFIDTSPSFEAIPRSGLVLNALDGHPNAAAHRIFADAIQESMTRMGLLPR